MTVRAGDEAMVHNDLPPTWETSSALSTVRGIQWWAAVLLAFGFTGIGVVADLQRINKLGLIFQACYFLGCVLAVLWVQRCGLFGPMVQPPLILAVAVPGVVLTTGGAGGGGLGAKALAIGTPLINGFPTMAITTGVTVLIGLARILQQRAPRQAPQPQASRRQAPSRQAPSRQAPSQRAPSPQAPQWQAPPPQAPQPQAPQRHAPSRQAPSRSRVRREDSGRPAPGRRRPAR